jgi:hypothetical protein
VPEGRGGDAARNNDWLLPAQCPPEDLAPAKDSQGTAGSLAVIGPAEDGVVLAVKRLRQLLGIDRGRVRLCRQAVPAR